MLFPIVLPVVLPFVLPVFLQVSLQVSSAGAAPAPATHLAPEAALKELRQGNKRFISGNAHACADASAERAELKAGQAPNTIVLSCSDSRVPPEQVFDQKLGKLFVVRVAGNVLSTDAIASMEYAIANLGSRLILVLGHESCGAVEAALKTPAGVDAGSPSLDELLGRIRGHLGDAKSSSKDKLLREPVMQNVSAVAAELLKRSKIVSDAVSQGRVKIERGIYDIADGQVDFWEK